MFSTEEKFEYFLTVEKQIHVIIKANYNVSRDKIIEKINQLIQIQNGKSALLLELDTTDYEDGGELMLYLNEYVRMKGKKKVFQTSIPFQAIIREIRLDIILGKDI